MSQHNPQVAASATTYKPRSPYLLNRSLGQETASLDTFTATAALREQMRVEMVEVEDFERRAAKALSEAPAQQAQFLLAASYLVQQHPELTAVEAVAETRSRFVEAKVDDALQIVRQKWHDEIFFRPKHFTLGDERERAMAEEHTRLLAEETSDYNVAKDMVHKLCNFLTCEGKMMSEWKEALEERAAIIHNGNTWTPNSFDRVIIQIGHHVTGTVVPEGLAKTIFDFLDTKESGVLQISHFFEVAQEAAEKATQAKAKAKQRKEKKSNEQNILKVSLSSTTGRGREVGGEVEGEMGGEMREEGGDKAAAVQSTVLANALDQPLISAHLLTENIEAATTTESHYVVHLSPATKQCNATTEKKKQEEDEKKEEERLQVTNSDGRRRPWYKRIFFAIINAPFQKRRWQQKQQKLEQEKEAREQAVKEKARNIEVEKLKFEVEHVKREAMKLREKEKIRVDEEIRNVKEMAQEATERTRMVVQDVLSFEMRRWIPVDMYKKGACVRVNFAGRGHLYPARIVACKKDDTFLVRYMDGDQEDNVPRSRVVVVHRRK